jgi:hypothetical protein
MFVHGDSLQPFSLPRKLANPIRLLLEIPLTFGF